MAKHKKTGKVTAGRSFLAKKMTPHLIDIPQDSKELAAHEYKRATRARHGLEVYEGLPPKDPKKERRKPIKKGKK